MHSQRQSLLLNLEPRAHVGSKRETPALAAAAARGVVALPKPALRSSQYSNLLQPQALRQQMQQDRKAALQRHMLLLRVLLMVSRHGRQLANLERLLGRRLLLLLLLLLRVKPQHRKACSQLK
jgi:hypothetical protein